MKRILFFFLLISVTARPATSTIDIPDTFNIGKPTIVGLAGLGYVGTGLTILAGAIASALVATHKNPNNQLSTTQVVVHAAAALVGGGLSFMGIRLIYQIPAPANHR